MAAAVILNLLFLSILVTRSTSGSSRRHYSKISFCVNRRLNYCCLCKNSRLRPLLSWILFCSIFWHACM